MTDPNVVIDVDIDIQDSSAAAAAFGEPLILAKAPYLGVRRYECNADGLAAMVVDGFTVGSAAYVIAQTFASQDPCPETFKVGGRATVNAQSYTITPTITTLGYHYTGTVVGSDGIAVDFDYTVDGDDTVATIIDGILADFVATGVTETDNTTAFELSQTVAGSRFHLRNFCAGLTVDDRSADAGIAADLAAVQAADSDWYGLVVDSTSGAEIVAAAAWAQANSKLFLASSLDSDVTGSGTADVASTIKATNADRVAVAIGRDGYSRIGDASLARQLAIDPGVSTFALQTLVGPMVDNWTATELANLRGKNAMPYVSSLGLSFTLDGKTAMGRFLDLRRDTDWLRANLQADVLTLFVSQEKVPFTDVGIGQIESVARRRLAIARDLGIVAPGFTVTPPAASASSTADKAARILRNFKWSGVIQGAIHKAEMRGTLTV